MPIVLGRRPNAAAWRSLHADVFSDAIPFRWPDEVGGAAASNFRSLDLAPPLSLADRGNVCYFVSMSDAVCEFFRFEFRAYRLVRPWSA